jgi:hypothetical protein
MLTNKLMAAMIAGGLLAGLGAPAIAGAETPAPTGQHGFFVPGVGGSNVAQDYLHPDTPFPIHTVNNGFSGLDIRVAAGVANLVESIKQNAAPYQEFGDFVHVVCYGAGCLVAHQTKPAFEEGGELSQYKLFEVTGFRDPGNGDGGILTKLPGFSGVNQDDYKDATYESTVTHEYDLVSDAPDKFGVLAFLNSVAAAHYYSDRYNFEELSSALNEGRAVVTVTTNDEDGSTRTHYLITHDNLPITRPLRDFFLAINNDAGDANVNGFFDRVDDVLRPHIDSKYDKGPNPEVNQREQSTVNGAPFTPAPVETGDDEETNEVASFSEPVNNDVDNGDQGDSGNGVTPGGGSTPGTSNSSTEEEPAKKTWKERQAERRAEREAKVNEFNESLRDNANKFGNDLRDSVNKFGDDLRNALNPKKKPAGNTDDNGDDGNGGNTGGSGGGDGGPSGS